MIDKEDLIIWKCLESWVDEELRVRSDLQENPEEFLERQNRTAMLLGLERGESRVNVDNTKQG